MKVVELEMIEISELNIREKMAHWKVGPLNSRESHGKSTDFASEKQNNVALLIQYISFRKRNRK